MYRSVSLQSLPRDKITPRRLQSGIINEHHKKVPHKWNTDFVQWSALAFYKKSVFSTETSVQMLRWCIWANHCVTKWDGLHLYCKELEFQSFPSFLLLKKKKPQILVVQKLYFQVKDCASVAMSNLSLYSKHLSKTRSVSRRLLLHCGCNKAQKSGRCTGLQFRQCSLGIKNNLFLLVPHTVKQS